jgi:hypothetical protein
MPGWIHMTFGREPDFFQALNVQGKFNQVLVAREGSHVVGMGCRSIKPVWVNGQTTEIGYLGGLRLIPEVRRTGALARGYAALRQLHEDNPVPAYLTTIVEGNTEAAAVLTSDRAGLPHYLDYGRYFTYAINLNRFRRKPSAIYAIRRGEEAGCESVMQFLSEVGRRRQFFPSLDSRDFQTDYLRGLRVNDFRVAVQEGKTIMAAAAVWDQNSFKQNIVQGYSTPVRLLRPTFNFMLRLSGFRPLPPPGGTLSVLCMAFCCSREEKPAALRALLEGICEELRGSPHHYLVMGFHEQDPMRTVMSGFPAFRYTSRLHLVYWDDGQKFANNLDRSRIPHLEVATL